MPALTKVEKIAGRYWRAKMQDDLTKSIEENPPDFKHPSFISHCRHECPARRMISTAIQMVEVYKHSPEFAVSEETGDVYEVDPVTDEDGELAPLSLPPGYVAVPAGRFGFWWKEGKCRGKECKATVKSPAGVFVDAYDRPPAEGRVARAGA